MQFVKFSYRRMLHAELFEASASEAEEHWIEIERRREYREYLD